MATSASTAMHLTLAGALVCTLGANAAAQPAPFDLQVNTYTTGLQTRPAVAMDAEENFVVVWESPGQDGDNKGIFGRRFDRVGTPLGPEFQVNTYTTGYQAYPKVAMRSTGDFVVVWEGPRTGSPARGVFARIFDDSGSPAGPEFPVSASTTRQHLASVAVDESGRFVVVWAEGAGGGPTNARGRRFDASGTPSGTDFLVSEYSTSEQAQPSVAADSAGNFVVVWVANPGGADPCANARAFGRRFDASGAPLTPDFPVAGNTSQTQSAPRVALAESGTFMVVWHSPGCLPTQAIARVFDGSGTPLGSDFQVDTSPQPSYPDDENYAVNPAVDADDGGRFVVAWHRSTYFSGDEELVHKHIRTRRYDASGAPLEPGSLANRGWSHYMDKRFPSIAAGASGRFVVAWDAQSSDGNAYGVFARSADLIFVDSFEMEDLSTWSNASTDGGDATTATAANLGPPGSEMGLHVTVDDTAAVHVEDRSPEAEPRYRTRFLLDPNGFDPGESIGQFRQRVFLAMSEAPLKRLVLVMLRRLGGQFAIGVHVRRDDDTLAKSSFFPVTDAPHAIEIDWQKATAPGANDGRLELWIDGVSVTTLTGLDNDQRPVDLARLGAVSVKAGAAGTLYFDDFVSRRLAYIGP